MSTLIVSCEKCDRSQVFDCDDFHWEAVASDERGMGEETLHVAQQQARCECGNHISVELLCWEYPVGAVNTTDIQVSGGKLVSNDCETCPDLSE